MKKILLFMLPVMALIFTSCEKNNEKELSGDDVIQFEDPNFLKALLVVQETSIYNPETDDYEDCLIDVDANKDGKITVNEAKKVRALVLNYNDGEHADVVGFNIERMPEIKYFTSLEYLDCWANEKLTSLDLSNNTALTYLACRESQLTSLDVSNCTALTYLDCCSNQLTTLDVSNNTALTELSCYSNQLTTLDVSNNTALSELLCGDNQLTSLDVSNNTALTALGCDGNLLSTLDLSNCTALTYLDCYDNLLTTLYLSNNTVLTYLDCSRNQLTSLDLYNNRLIESLWCENNPLQKLILYKYHIIYDGYMKDIESEYGDIIEYVE